MTKIEILLCDFIGTKLKPTSFIIDMVIFQIGYQQIFL